MNSRWRFPLLVAAGWPVWAWLATRLDASDEQATALLAAAGAGLVAWRWAGEAAGEGGAAAGEAAKRGDGRAAMVAVVVYALAYAWLPMLGRAGLYALALGLVLPSLGVAKRVRGWLVLLLMLALPVVPTVQFYFGYPLRLGVAAMTEGIVRLGGFAVEAQGTSLVWAGGEVLVDGPCAGVRMAWTGLWLAALVGGWNGLGARAGAGLLAVAGLIVLLGNVARAVLLFLLEVKAPDLAANATVHSGVGLVVFAVGMAGIAWMGWRLRMSDTSGMGGVCA